MGSSQSSSASLTSSRQDLVQTGEATVLRHPSLRHVKKLRTAVGLLSVIVVFMCAVNSVLSITAVPVGIYMFVIGVPMFLLEYGRFIRTVCGTDGFCCRTFGFVLGFDKKKRGILYFLMSIPLYLGFLRNTFSISAGVFIIMTGVLYLLKGCETKRVPAFISNPNYGVQPARENTQDGTDSQP